MSPSPVPLDRVGSLAQSARDALGGIRAWLGDVPILGRVRVKFGAPAAVSGGTGQRVDPHYGVPIAYGIDTSFAGFVFPQDTGQVLLQMKRQDVTTLGVNGATVFAWPKPFPNRLGGVVVTQTSSGGSTNQIVVHTDTDQNDCHLRIYDSTGAAVANGTSRGISWMAWGW